MVSLPPHTHVADKFEIACRAWHVLEVTDRSVSRVDTRQVDFGDELDEWWLVGVLIATVHLEAVNPVFVNTL